MSLFSSKGTLLVGAIGISLGMVCCWICLHRSSPRIGSWLAVSNPVVSFRSSGKEMVASVRLNITNAGFRALEGAVQWYEVRDAFNQRLRRPSEPAHGYSFPMPGLPDFQLGPGAVTNLDWELGPFTRTNEVLRICASLFWVEMPPRLTSAFRQWPLFRVAEAVESVHKFDTAPWNWHPAKMGRRFASNVGPADFFSEVYGWTSSEGPRARTMGGGDNAEWLAAMAFDEFCAIQTRLDQSGRAANQGQPARSQINQRPSGAGSDR
jgi:hypothetical protein